MNLKQAMKRIEDWERKVQELESRPKQEIHYHYPVNPNTYQPAYPYPNTFPPYITSRGPEFS